MIKSISFYIIIFSAVIILFFLFIVFTHYKVSTKYTYKIFTITDVLSHDAGLVLGAQIWSNSQPSHILEDRLLVSIELYKSGKINKLILSGDHSSKYYDEVNVMREYALAHGVSDHDIFMDHAGVSTYDSLFRARDVFNLESLIIITNSFHLPRALFIANELGINAVGVASDLRKYQGENYNNFREFLANIKANFDLIFTAKPKFLGPKIDITGSGLVTHDSFSNLEN